MTSPSIPLPETTCVFHGNENRLVLVFPLTRVPYRVNMEEIPPGWSQLRQVLERVINACKAHVNGAWDNSYYASISLTKEDWEWVLTFSSHQKTKTP